MNYIFLDIDGVLNNGPFIDSLNGEWGLDPAPMKILSLLCKKFNAKVVLSSGWRRDFKNDMTPCDHVYKVKEFWEKLGIYEDTDAEILLKTFKNYDIEIIGKTDEERIREEGWDRIGQINRYIKNHLDKNDNFIIIDDEDIFKLAAPLTKEEEKLYSHYIQPDYDKDGLDEECYLKACKIFRNADLA